MTFAKTLRPEENAFFEAYCENPVAGYAVLSKNTKAIGRIHDILLPLRPKAKEVVHIADHFENGLETALLNNSFDIIFAGIKKDAVVVENKKPYLGKQCNVFQNEIGFSTSKYDPQIAAEIGTDKVKVEAGLHVVVARKK